MSDQPVTEPVIEEHLYALKDNVIGLTIVLGASVFGMLWGVVNTILVRYL